MRLLFILAAMTVGIWLPGFAADPPTASPAPVVTPELERGKTIVQQAFALLSTNLASALKAGGVTNALPYCSVAALPLTKLVGDTNRVILKRVTHKPRNPANRASEGELRIIDSFRSAVEAGQTPSPILRTNRQGQVTFLAPIVINNDLCLNCHGQTGKDVKPETLALLKQLYPHDEATGFKQGDLRGMWRVDFLKQ